jgi:hypothetical protein
MNMFHGDRYHVNTVLHRVYTVRHIYKSQSLGLNLGQDMSLGSGLSYR